MKVTVFSAKRYDRESLALANRGNGHEFFFIGDRLREDTAPLARGAEAVCVFVHDEVNRAVLSILAENDCRFVVLRCAGFNNVDRDAAQELGISVARVPAYSPHAVAEFAVGLILSLNRRIHRAYARIREHDFSIDGLQGFDLNGKTVGVVGTGKIGTVFAAIMKGFGCRILAYDPYPNEEITGLGGRYAAVDEILSESDVISLHCPLTPGTHHLLNNESLARIKKGAMIINTSRGGLIDSEAAIDRIKDGTIGALGLDVYEEEEGIFFMDFSEEIIEDDRLLRLTSFPNVLVTSHQAFFTKEAISSIAETTLLNLDDYAAGRAGENRVC